MAIKFEVALDACIGLLMQGMPVDDCLARFPELADELRPHLAAFSRAVGSASAEVSADAKAKGRERLRAERAALEERERRGAERGPSRYRWFPEGWRYPAPRWATMAAAVLILIIGGTGTVAASRGSLPGDTFYPVKLASERMQLALEFSESDQAELHVAFAEKRARELSTLLARQDYDQVGVAAMRLSSHLEAATDLQPQISPAGIDQMQAQISASSASVLAGLQTALAAEGRSSQRAEQAFNSVGAAYARALERISPSGSQPIAAALNGTLQLRAADPPPEGVDQVTITITRIEALLTGAGQRWVTAIDGPVTLELRHATDLPRYLGEATVPAGTYTRVRFQIDEAFVIAGGVVHQAGLAGSSFEFPRPFRVAPDQTTVVVLDFDGRDTVRISSKGNFVVEPDVRVRATEPGVTPIVPERPRGPRPTTSAKPANASPSPTPSPRPAVTELRGVVEASGPDFITVQGKRIEISTPAGGKEAEAAPARGTQVRVEVDIEETGEFRAVEIEVLATPRGEGRPGTPTAVPSPTPAGVTGTPAEFSGIVGSVAGNRWIVAGRPVLVDKDTRIGGEEPTVGGAARVIGILGTDGIIRANVIIVEAVPAATATAPAPTPALTQQATPGPARTPEKRTPEKPTPTAQPQRPALSRVIEIKGEIESLDGGLWRVDGRQVRITAATVVIGVAAVGAEAQIVGSEQADGSILAVTVKIKAKNQEPPPFRLVGQVEEIDSTRIVVDGRSISIGTDVTVSGRLEAGATVRVDGVTDPGGNLRALNIEVLAPPRPESRQGSTPSPTPGKQATPVVPTVPPAVPTPAVTPVATLPVTVVVPTAPVVPAPSPTVTPTPTTTPTATTAGPQTVSFDGTITSVSGVQVIIGGTTVIVPASLGLQGLMPGLNVHVEGKLQPDGTVIATSVTIK